MVHGNSAAPDRPAADVRGRAALGRRDHGPDSRSAGRGAPKSGRGAGARCGCRAAPTVLRSSRPPREWLSKRRGAEMMPSLPSGTVTFLFTDIEGSTRLWERD